MKKTLRRKRELYGRSARVPRAALGILPSARETSHLIGRISTTTAPHCAGQDARRCTRDARSPSTPAARLRGVLAILKDRINQMTAVNAKRGSETQSKHAVGKSKLDHVESKYSLDQSKRAQRGSKLSLSKSKHVQRQSAPAKGQTMVAKTQTMNAKTQTMAAKAQTMDAKTQAFRAAV